MGAPKILIADDDPGVRLLLETTLRDEGFDLLYARDGEEAVRVAIDKQPDIVLLDVMMPKMDGYRVCEILKSTPETMNSRVLMVTAKAGIAGRAVGREAGADGHISKPFSPSVLVNRVRQILANTGES